MSSEEMLVTLSWVVNRSLGQTKFLFDLCDNDVDKLLKLEAYQKRTFKYACPADKETVDEQLADWERLRTEDKTKEKKNV